MENTAATRTATTNPRTERETAEYKRIHALFSAQIAERPDWAITPDELNRAVRDMMAIHARNRRARLVDCPCCGVKRRDPGYELCAECARETAAEDARQAKSKARPPTAAEVEHRSRELIRRQYAAACHELFKLWCLGALPESCRVVKVSDKELRIQAPSTLFILDLRDVLWVEEKPAPAAASAQPYGNRRRKAPVFDFPVKTDEVDAGWEETG